MHAADGSQRRIALQRRHGGKVVGLVALDPRGQPDVNDAITWPLWQVRLDPPPLPLWPLPALPFGGVLLATLAVVLVRPRLGAVLHAALVLLAVVADQTREQPQVLSLAFLLGATAFPRQRAIDALHLAALWCWSGLGKLLSPRFLAEDGAWLLGGSVCSRWAPARGGSQPCSVRCCTARSCCS